MPYDMIWLQKKKITYSKGETEHEKIKNLIRTIGAKFVTARRRQKNFPLLLLNTIFHSFLSISLFMFLSFAAGSCQAIFFLLSFISMKNLCMCEMMLCKEFLFIRLPQTFQHTGQRSFICMI